MGDGQWKTLALIEAALILLLASAWAYGRQPAPPPPPPQASGESSPKRALVDALVGVWQQEDRDGFRPLKGEPDWVRVTGTSATRQSLEHFVDKVAEWSNAQPSEHKLACLEWGIAYLRRFKQCSILYSFEYRSKISFKRAGAKAPGHIYGDLRNISHAPSGLIDIAVITEVCRRTRRPHMGRTPLHSRYVVCTFLTVVCGVCTVCCVSARALCGLYRSSSTCLSSGRVWSRCVALAPSAPRAPRRPLSYLVRRPPPSWVLRVGRSCPFGTACAASSPVRPPPALLC